MVKITSFLILLITVFSASAHELMVFQSDAIRSEDFFVELKRIERESAHRKNILQLEEERLRRRHESVRQLSSEGFRSPIELKNLQLKLDRTTNRLSAREVYDRFLDLMIEDLEGRELDAAPASESREAPRIRLRLPGLSLRVGDADYFTVQMEATPEISDAVRQYATANLLTALEYPNPFPHMNYGKERLDSYANLEAALPSEVWKWQHRVDLLKEHQHLANTEFRNRWQQLRQIWQFHQHLQGWTAHRDEVTSFQGSPDSYWLFGDGHAQATPFTGISHEALEIAEQHAESRHNRIRSIAVQAQAQRQLSRVKVLVRDGYSNEAEVRNLDLTATLADLNTRILQADKEVRLRQLDQLKVATRTLRDEPTPHALPGEQPENAPAAWFQWLADGPSLDASELLRFLPLFEAKSLARADVAMARAGLDHQERIRREYLKIGSLQPVEVDQIELSLSAARAELEQALEADKLSTLRIRQWTLRNRDQHQTNEELSPDTMAEVMMAGKEVNLARVKRAELEIEKARAILRHDRDYLKRIRAVYQKGAASQSEWVRANNQVARSEGQLASSERRVRLVRREAQILDTIFDHGGLNYTDKGLEMTYFSPELIGALRLHADLSDSADEGRLRIHSADLNDVNLRINNLDTLIADGYASPVERRWATRDKEMIENRISVEKARSKMRDYAIAVIESLETRPDREDAIEANEATRL